MLYVFELPLDIMNKQMTILDKFFKLPLDLIDIIFQYLNLSNKFRKFDDYGDKNKCSICKNKIPTVTCISHLTFVESHKNEACIYCILKSRNWEFCTVNVVGDESPCGKIFFEHICGMNCGGRHIDLKKYRIG